MQPIPLYPQFTSVRQHINRREHKWELTVKNATHSPITHTHTPPIKRSENVSNLRWALH